MSKLAEILKIIRNGVSHLKTHDKNVYDAGEPRASAFLY